LLGVVEDELREHRVLHSSIGVLDGFLGGFESSKLSLIDSSSGFVFDFLYALCVRSIIDLNSDVVFVDGGNRMNPYAISALCKRYRADKHLVLSRINVARAFTAYQLASIIEDELGSSVEDNAAEVVVVSCLPTLFRDEDLRPSESRSMYRRCIDSLKELAVRHNLITIVTNYEKGKHVDKRSQRPLLKKYLCEKADKIVRFERGRTLRVWNESEHSYIEYHPVPFNQMVIEDFLGDLSRVALRGPSGKASEEVLENVMKGLQGPPSGDPQGRGGDG
jgi:hypothetical protein